MFALLWACFMINLGVVWQKEVLFYPRALQGKVEPVLETSFLGRDYSVPIGIAPIGATGMMWPGTEADLARFAAQKRVPYGLSTVATQTPDDIGPIAGEYGWFQLYPLGGDGVQEDILKRAQAAGYKTLILTVDVPINSRRERQRRAGFNMPVIGRLLMIFVLLGTVTLS